MLLKLSIIVWPILEMKPVFPWPMSHTQSHAAKSSSLCSLAAEVQMVCLYASLTQCRSFTSALLCLVLLDSVHHSSTPDTLLGFALSSSLCHTFQLSHSFFFVSLLPEEHSLKVFTQSQKFKKRSIRFPLLWPNHTIHRRVYLKCLQCYLIYISWWSYPCLNLNEKVCVFLNTSTVSPVAFREWILSYYCIRSTMSMFSHGSFDTFPTSLHWIA